MSAQIFSRFLQYAVDAKVIYVDTAGSDTAENGRGGVLQPFATITAAVAGLTTGNYILVLGEGSYASPASWPTAAGLNINVVGQGSEMTTITGAIAYTSAAQADNVAFVGVKFSGNVTFDFTLATAGAIVNAYESTFANIIRTDSNANAALITYDSLVSAFTTAGTLALQSSRFTGAGVTQSGAIVAFRSGVIGPAASVALVAGATARMDAVASLGSFTGSAGTLTADASSLKNSTISGFSGTLSLLDTAPFEAFTPTIPANYPGGTATVQQALDAINSVAANLVWNRESIGPLTALQISGGVTLAHSPTVASVRLLVEGAGNPLYTTDYSVAGTLLTFSAGLQALMTAGVTNIEVQYQY